MVAALFGAVAQELPLPRLLVRRGIHVNDKAIKREHLSFRKYEGLHKVMSNSSVNVAQVDANANASALRFGCQSVRGSFGLKFQHLRHKHQPINNNDKPSSESD